MTQLLFILSLFKHGFKVRWTTAYFVLIGKKTNSVITYANAYQLLPYFHLFPKLSKDEMFQFLKQLEEQKLITLEGDYVQITDSGIEKCHSLDFTCTDSLNRFEDYQVCQDIFERWLLICQMVSQKSYQKQHYIPVSRQFKIQKQVQYQWIHTGISFEVFQPLFKQELKRFLEQFSPRISYIYTCQLSGYKVIAKTNDQLSELLSIPSFEIQLWIENLKSILCQLPYEEYPWICYFIAPQLNPTNTLYSIIKNYVNEYYPIDTISQRVNRKVGTVLDYVVEIAIKEEHFPFTYYIGKYDDALENYYQKHPNIGHWNYKDIREDIGEIPFSSYRLFQIQKGKSKC